MSIVCQIGFSQWEFVSKLCFGKISKLKLHSLYKRTVTRMEDWPKSNAQNKNRLAVLGGVTLYMDDISCLFIDDDWLNDSVIHFYLEYLRYYKFQNHTENIEVLSPAVVQCIKVSTSQRVLANMVAPLKLPKKKVVVLPINNASGQKNSSCSGETHWSVLVLTPADGHFYHFDSVGTNRGAAKTVAGKLQRQLSFPSPRLMHLGSATKDNSWDCGLFTLMNAERAISHLVQGRDGSDLTPARKQDVEKMREHVLKVVRDVSKEQQQVVEEDDPNESCLTM